MAPAVRLNDETYKVGPGDLAAVFPGGAHALENSGEEGMRIIVVSVTATAGTLGSRKRNEKRKGTR